MKHLDIPSNSIPYSHDLVRLPSIHIHTSTPDLLMLHHPNALHATLCLGNNLTFLQSTASQLLRTHRKNMHTMHLPPGHQITDTTAMLECLSPWRCSDLPRTCVIAADHFRIPPTPVPTNKNNPNNFHPKQTTKRGIHGSHGHLEVSRSLVSFNNVEIAAWCEGACARAGWCGLLDKAWGRDWGCGWREEGAEKGDFDYAVGLGERW